MVDKTSISRDAESYRRGVVFGLTMAEVLLLLVFSILLFLQLTSERLAEHKALLREAEVQEARLIEDLAVLKAVLVNQPEGAENSEFLTKIVEAAAILESNQPEKAEAILQAIQDNPILLQQVQLSTVDEWAELTAEAQYSIPESEYRALVQLSVDQRQELFSNVETFASKKIVESNDEKPGNNWPPIISLSEAKNFSFTVGNATLAPEFSNALKGTIAKEILKILEDYNADVIEVIGHTDPQPMSNNRTTNLDDNALNFLNLENNTRLQAKDNAGLGYARALSVTRELMKVPSLQSYTILPYSAAQMITPDEKLQTGSAQFDGKQLRRIEIRVRRKQ